MNFLLIGSISGILVVIIGAFGAHGLQDILDDYGKSVYDKAVLYQMFYTTAILALGCIHKIEPQLNLSLAGWCFLLGILIFSGSLYILSITGMKWLGMITPIGGLFFIIGWIIFLTQIR